MTNSPKLRLAFLALLFIGSFAQAETYTDDTIPTVDITTDAIFDITNTAAYSGVISGSGTVSKIGAGGLTLSGANTYTGATTVSAGTLTFSSSALPKSAMTATGGTLVLGTTGNAITASGGTKIKTDSGAVRVDGNLNVNSGILTVKGDWTGAGAINVNGDTTATGQLRVDTSFSYATGITLNGGILRNSNDTDTNVTINAPINVASDSSLQSGWSKFVTLSGALTGSGNITIPTDSGYVRFEGDGSGYNGALTVQGKIRIGVNGTDTTNSKNFIGSKTITLDGGTIMNSNNSVTITNDIVMSKESYFQAGWGNNNKTIKLTGSISGSGKFHVLSDSGKVIVSTTCTDNSFTGDVHTDYESDSKFGSLQLGTDNPFGTNAGEARIWGTLDLNGHKQTFAGLANSATATTGKVKGNNSSVLTLKLNSNASKVYGGVFEGTMNLVLTGDGTGTQILKKAPAYTGSTTVQAGTLQLDAGGTLYNLSGAGTVKFGSKTLTLSNSADTTFSGSLSGSGKVTFKDNSSWIEMATTCDSFTGDVQIDFASADNQGRVRLGKDNPFGTTAGQANIYGTLDMNGYSQTFKGLYNNGDKGSIYNNNSDNLSTLTIDTTSKDLTFRSSIAGNVALVLTGTGKQTLNKAPEYTGSTTIESGTLALSAGGTLYNLSGAGTLNYGANALILTNTADTEFSGALSGSGKVTFQNGSGWIEMAQPGAFTGDVQLNYANSDSQGRVRLGADNALGTANRAYVYGTLDMNGYDQSFAGLSNNGDKGSIFNETDTLSTLTIDTTSLTASSQFQSSIKDNIALVITGTGTQTLKKAPEYSGSTTIESGTLVLSNGGELFNLSGGSLDSNGEIAVAATLDASGKALTLSNDQMTKFIGSIKADSIVKTGDGTLQIYAAAEGLVNASSFVVSSGRLDMKEYFKGSLAVEAGATLSPGNSVGTLTVDGEFSLDSGATLLMEVGKNDQGEIVVDQLILSDDIGESPFAQGSIINIVLDPASGLQGGDSFTDLVFITTTSDADAASIYDAVKKATISYYFPGFEVKLDGKNILLSGTLSANAVPEPSTWALLVLGVAGLMYWRKRKN